MQKAKLRLSASEKLLNGLNYLLVGLFTFLCFYPFYYIIIYSVSNATEASQGIYLWPRGFTLELYENIFQQADLIHAFTISALRTVLGTILCVLASSMFAYLLIQREMLFRKVVYRLVIITMYLNAGLIPWYITMKMYGLKNNFLLYILPGMINAFYLILMKTYIEQLPASLEESAALDGAGFFTKFFKVVLPLSKPILATIAVYSAVGQWNSWLDNYFLASDKKLQTLQLILYKYLNQAEALANSMKNASAVSNATAVSNINPTNVRMATIVVTVVPIMLVYPFLQKYFAKGILLGAVKG
ncbi:carbohydrate ABC transporter permease [Oscillospiraceae bacterium HV4-5-C5C]|nr:carbohydrate ABC transporter permease [Oscillospiraceae bacterium HV4-5-C5C]